jgi:transcriptional regulator with XRE-family HTH domain
MDEINLNLTEKSPTGAEIREIALRIRELREACGYSVAETAKWLGIDESVYSDYENSGDDIPISVIYQLAGKFGVDFTEIITGINAKLDTYHYVAKGQGKSVDRHPGYTFFDLAHRYSHKIMQPLLVVLQPDGKKPEFVTHSGQEFNLVLEGGMVLYFDNKEIILNEGDSVYFNPKHPHGQRCLGDKETKFLTVITN